MSMTPLGLAEQKVSLTYKIEDKREREKKEKEDSRAPGAGNIRCV